jgi:hypothetical protein
LIAQYFALHHPDQVASLTLLGGYDINADNAGAPSSNPKNERTAEWSA